MSAEYMRRNVKTTVRFSEAEHELLKARMAMIGTTNQEAFIRKMALDGIIVKLDVPEIKEMISLLRYSGIISTRLQSTCMRPAEPTIPTLRIFRKIRKN